MSSVAEMSALCREAADYRSKTPNWKDRVTAAARVFGFTWSRAKAFYYEDARRVEAREMDHARRIIRELRARRKAAELATQFHATIAHLRQTDEEFYSGTIDGLERALMAAGLENSPVDEPETQG